MVLGWAWQHRRSKALERKHFSEELLERWRPAHAQSSWRVRAALWFLATVMLVTAGANPQVGARSQKAKRQGLEVIIALDISRSMLAQDLQPSRLERAKLLTLKFLDGLRGNKVGLIYFAGQAYVQMPLTADFGAAELLVKSANTELLTLQGTVLAEAIALAGKTFDPKDKKSKVLLLITDGEDQEEGAVGQARAAKDEGVTVFTIGIGSPEGAPITRENQEVVVSRLNTELLEEVAAAGEGKYYLLQNEAATTKQLLDDLSQLEQKEFEQVSFKAYDTLGQIFLVFGVLLLCIEFLLSNKHPQLTVKGELK